MVRQTTELSFPPPETDSAVAALDAQIASERSTIVGIERELREHKQSLARLEEARKALVRTRAPRKAPKARRVSTAVKTAAQRAGRGNIVKARDLLQHNGPMTKASITKELGINDGTVTYALRALEETGEVQRTGERVHGSDVFEYVTRRRVAVTRPGDRR